MKIQLKLPAIFLLLALMVSILPPGVTVGYAADGVCDQAELIAHVSVPDGTNFAPGTVFKKTWSLKNIGTCTWAATYLAVFDTGEKMNAPASVSLPAAVAPGQTVDIGVDLTAPGTAGTHIGNWKLKNVSGTLFGTGTAADKPFSVNIVVTSAPVVTGDYDFTAHAADADVKWSSGAGPLTFGTDATVGPVALKLDKPKFEDGKDTYGSGLLFVPNNAAKGFVQAIYPAFVVQSGDRFQSQIGCQDGATTCYVAFRLQYQIVDPNGVASEVKTFWKEPPFRERYEGRTYLVNLNLSSLAGKNIKFILSVSDYDGAAAGDRALWGGPRITRSGGGVPPCTDIAKFKSDLEVTDGKTFAPGQTFTKKWQLQNIGTCTWTTAYQLVFDSGATGSNRMGGPETALMPISVSPGQTVEISVNLTAPTTGGTYIGYWKFKNDKGVSFALAPFGNKLLGNQKSFWVRINVAGTGTVP